ncbi:DinB/UmuC family translesion DNA polymerase [Limnochorda pilosa]|uniref:DNA polymerase Y-family little finger domain-containing protein n=1 Tax=Limnochorda pilosa TaxID=1555112 RepID=A0A0K2SK33_LIMPI|nr:hypothetical protein [Limnochorda pilosa]BAS27377.1 hypothetical protein LIP_1530 [Limnochorda pilosa]
MGFVLHVRITGGPDAASSATRSGADPASLLRPPAAPPPEEWAPDHPLLPLLEAVASLTPRVEPFTEHELFAALDPGATARLGRLLDRLQEGPPVLAVLASSRLVARAAGVRLLLQPPPPGRGTTWEQPSPTLYQVHEPARFLAPLPLAYLWTLPAEVLELERLGVWRIGQVSGVAPPGSSSSQGTSSRGPSFRENAPARIPRTLLVGRLGSTLARRLVEASLGVDPTPVRDGFPRPAIRLERPVPDGFDGSQLEGMLRSMAAELAEQLQRQGLGASRLTLRLAAPGDPRPPGDSDAPAHEALGPCARRLPEPVGDPRRIEREGLRLARTLFPSRPSSGAPPPPGTRLVLEADRLAPPQVHQVARLVSAGGAREIPPALAETLEQAHRRFGQAAPVSASRLPVSRRERMLRLWQGPL